MFVAFRYVHLDGRCSKTGLCIHKRLEDTFIFIDEIVYEINMYSNVATVQQ
jgi:hypothetical protein